MNWVMRFKEIHFYEIVSCWTVKITIAYWQAWRKTWLGVGIKLNITALNNIRYKNINSLTEKEIDSSMNLNFALILQHFSKT